MHRDARLLKGKALASFRRSARAFNDLDDEGRVTTVLLHLQHAFEMLLKAALVERNVRVFDKTKGRSLGFEKCVRLAAEHLPLSDEQSGLLRTLDALRDDEQHYFGELNDGLLYLHVRAGVTLFAELLDKNDALDGATSLAHTPSALAAVSNCSSRTYTRYPKEPRPSVTPEDA